MSLKSKPYLFAWVPDDSPRPRRSVDFALMALYVAAIVVANWLVTRYGQAALPYTAFFLIPFDLIVRDLFQDRWQAKRFLGLRMAILIAGGALISLATSTGSLRVNLASLTAFAVAGTIDALTYQKMIVYGRIFRINGATCIAAVTDSIVFALIAFDHASWSLAAWQSATKIAGGFVWSLVMYRFFRRPISFEGNPIKCLCPDCAPDRSVGVASESIVHWFDGLSPSPFEYHCGAPKLNDSSGSVTMQAVTCQKCREAYDARLSSTMELDADV